MKLLTYLVISIAATALIYVLFSSSLDLSDIREWNTPAKGFFLLLVALVDLFLIRTYDKNKTK